MQKKGFPQILQWLPKILDVFIMWTEVDFMNTFIWMFKVVKISAFVLEKKPLFPVIWINILHSATQFHSFIQ